MNPESTVRPPEIWTSGSESPPSFGAVPKGVVDAVVVKELTGVYDHLGRLRAYVANDEATGSAMRAGLYAAFSLARLVVAEHLQAFEGGGS